MRLTTRIAMIAIGIALVLPGAALASSSSTCQNYNPQDCNSVVNQRDQKTTRTTTATVHTSASTLPFTGLDVGLLAAGGGILLGAGFVVRRLSRGAGQL